MKESYFNCNKDSNTVVDSASSKKHNMPVLNEGSYFSSKLFDMCVLDEIDMPTFKVESDLSKSLYKSILDPNSVKINNGVATFDFDKSGFASLNPESQQNAINRAINAAQSKLNTLNPSNPEYHRLKNRIELFRNSLRSFRSGLGTNGTNDINMWDSFKNELSGAWNHTADSFRQVFTNPSQAGVGQYATVGAVIAAGALGTYWLWKKFKKNGKLTEQDYREADNIQKEAEQRKVSGNYDANKQLAL